MPLAILDPNEAADANRLNRIFATLDQSAYDLARGEELVYQLNLDSTTGRGIVDGAITIDSSYYAIDTEDNADADDLHTIYGFATGDILFLQSTDAARVITVKHGLGNIYLAERVDVVMDDVRLFLALIYDGVKWCEVGSSDWDDKLNVGEDTVLEIKNDAIMMKRTRHRIDTEDGADEDNLKTIIGGRDGDVLMLNTVNGSRKVTIKAGTGNIRLRAGKDVTLDNPNRTMAFLYNGNNWLEITTDGLLAKDTLGEEYAPVRSLQLPRNTLQAMSGVDVYGLGVLPSGEVRDWIKIMASTSGEHFMSGQVAIDSTWDTIANDNGAGGSFWRIKTSGVSGNVANLSAPLLPTDIIRREWNPMFTAVVKMDGAKTNRRVWIGLIQDYTFADTPGSDEGINVIAFRYSTNVGDTTWKAVCGDGGSDTVVDTGVIVTNSDKFVLKFWVDSDNDTVYFSVNGSTPVSISTNLPATTTQMGMLASIETLTNAVKGLAIQSLYCEHD